MNISRPIHSAADRDLAAHAGMLSSASPLNNLLPVAALPKVYFPTITVTAQLPGASPETMASSVATPLEQQFAAIQGLDQMTSTSGLGSTSITLQFILTRNIDGAAQDVQTAINARQRAPAKKPAQPADLQEGQSGRPRHPDLRHLFRHDAALQGRRLRLHDPGAAPSTVEASRRSISAVSRNTRSTSRSIPMRSPPAASGSKTWNTLSTLSVDQPKGSFENAHQSATIDTNDQLFNAK